MGQLNHEPSMEDILASIKRIIAEDSEAAAPRAPRMRREMAAVPAPSLAVEEPMEAEDAPAPVADIRPAPAPFHESFAAAAAEQAAVFAPAAEAEPEPVAAAEPAADDADILELTSPIAEEAPRPVAAAPVAPEAPIAAPDRLTSDPAAEASRNAFAALSQMQVRADAGKENSLEGLVSDLLRPMLREWLDRELPALVERLVSAEVARLSGRG